MEVDDPMGTTTLTMMITRCPIHSIPCDPSTLPARLSWLTLTARAPRAGAGKPRPETHNNSHTHTAAYQSSPNVVAIPATNADHD